MSEGFICIAGKNNIAVDVLSYILTLEIQDWEIGVVCNRTETGVDGWQKSLRKFANENNIKEYQLKDIYEKRNVIFISLEFDRIVKPGLFVNASLYNIHFSLLPAYKGMYTSAIPILQGEAKTGVTFHLIDEGIDTGDIIDQYAFDIKENYTARDVYQRYIKYGTELVIKNIPGVLAGTVMASPQSSLGSTYYSKDVIDYGNVVIDIKQTANSIRSQIKAFSFREYQMPEINNRKIIDSKILESRSKQKPGTILFQDNNSFILATIDYDIQLYYDRFEELMEACCSGELEKVKEICVIQKHIFEKNKKGWTPLIVATYNGHLEIVNYLISIGADIYETNYNGTNLLMYAKEAYLRNGNNQIFLKYLQMGLDINREDNQGKNVLDYLQEDGYVLEEILEQT